MKQLLQEIGRITAAKERAQASVSEACGVKCAVVIHASVVYPKPIISVFANPKDIKRINSVFFTMNGDLFEVDTAITTDSDILESGLSDHIVAIIDILNTYF